jgi:DNA-binding Xre family transcriptional regulator
VYQRQTNLTELSERAGLSMNTLRNLVYVPNRQPTLDTCLRLAQALKVEPELVLQIADLHLSLPTNDQTLADPDRAELAQIWPYLPPANRRNLLALARSFLATAPTSASPMPTA